MDGRRGGWKDGQMDGWTDGRTDTSRVGQMDGSIHWMDTAFYEDARASKNRIRAFAEFAKFKFSRFHVFKFHDSIPVLACARSRIDFSHKTIEPTRFSYLKTHESVLLLFRGVSVPCRFGLAQNRANDINIDDETAVNRHIEDADRAAHNE